MRIQAAGIGFRHDAAGGGYVIKPMDFTLEPGTITLLVGRTGSGKSTVLHMLAGLKAPVPDGQIMYGETPLWKGVRPVRSLLNRIGFVYQYPEHQFFLPTVRGELKYSLRPYGLDAVHRDKRIADAASDLGLQEDLLERSPFFLSGGEKRKAALASVIATDPDWLLLDEPSSGLDSSMSSWLAGQMVRMKKERTGRGGLVIASHDLDLFLPVADRVVVLKDGTMLGSWKPSELAGNPEILEQAGVGVPACLRLASVLPGATHRFIREDIGLSADELAACLAEELPYSGQERTPGYTGTGQRRTTMQEHDAMTVRRDVISDTDSGLQPSDGHKADARNGRNPFVQLDPRAKWVVYLMFTFGILAQPGWQVTLLGMLLAAALAGIAGMPPAKWGRPLVPMVIFLFLSFGISGLELSISLDPISLAGTGFAWEPAWETLLHLMPLLPVMAGGILFASSTSPMSMKKGLEAPLKAIPGIGRWGEATAMTTSVLFRFMKWIPAEIERFSLLASVRGKKGGKPGRLKLLQLPSFFTPLLLSLLQHAEELSVALEARGYGRVGMKRTNAAPLRWKRIDGAACLAGAAMALLLAAAGLLSKM